MEITREIAIKVRDTVDAGLVKGIGVQVPGQMCVEAAVCYAMACLTATNHACVSPAIRQLKIQLNDSAWSSDKVRGAGMRRLALAQLGSAGVVDDVDFCSPRCRDDDSSLHSDSAARSGFDPPDCRT